MSTRRYHPLLVWDDLRWRFKMTVDIIWNLVIMVWSRFWLIRWLHLTPHDMTVDFEGGRVVLYNKCFRISSLLSLIRNFLTEYNATTDQYNQWVDLPPKNTTDSIYELIQIMSRLKYNNNNVHKNSRLFQLNI